MEAWRGSEARHSRQRINGKGVEEDRECREGKPFHVHTFCLHKSDLQSHDFFSHGETGLLRCPDHGTPRTHVTQPPRGRDGLPRRARVPRRSRAVRLHPRLPSRSALLHLHFHPPTPFSTTHIHLLYLPILSIIHHHPPEPEIQSNNRVSTPLA